MTALDIERDRSCERRELESVGSARRLLIGLAACIGLCAVSVAFLDRPIAFAIHALVRQPGTWSGEFIHSLGRAPDFHIAFALAVLSWFGIVMLLAWRRGLDWKRLGRAGPIILAALAVVLTNSVKAVLKLGFSRTWPETWTPNNPSLIRDGVYGFFPFHGGVGYGSFPSGHTATVCAAMTVLWWLWPRYRALYALAAAGAGLGLLGMNLHFLADVLAGAYLGWAVGELVVRYSGRVIN